jgi:hypothetical protein
MEVGVTIIEMIDEANQYGMFERIATLLYES